MLCCCWLWCECLAGVGDRRGESRRGDGDAKAWFKDACAWRDADHHPPWSSAVGVGMGVDAAAPPAFVLGSNLRRGVPVKSARKDEPAVAAAAAGVAGAFVADAGKKVEKRLIADPKSFEALEVAALTASVTEVATDEALPGSCCSPTKGCSIALL